MPKTRWWNRRRTGYAAAVTVPVLVGVLALTHEGFPVARLDLDDGGVWLTSRADLALGRFNVPVTELDGGLGTSGPDFDVLQDGSDVLLVEGTEVSVVDPATVATTSRTSVEAGAKVDMAGGTVLVSDSTGKVWVGTPSALPQTVSGSAEAPPTLDLGPGGAAVVARSGTVLAVDGKGQVTRATPGGGASADGSVKDLGAIDQITAVGDEPVVLDGSTVRTRHGSVRLDGTGLTLQQPGPAADAVLVASTTALYEVPMSGGHPTTRPTDSTGTPAAPVRVGDCAYGAWAAATGNWLRVCGSTVDSTDREEVTAAAELRFRVNRNQVVLNDVATGRVWLPDAPEVNQPAWNQITPHPDQDPNADNGEEPTTEHATQCSDEGQPPTAHDDEYGVRPGRSTTLRVLANDTTSDCGVLVISAVDDLPDSFGTVRVVDSGRALEVDVLATATGSVSFTYTATDRPGVRAPATATVRLTVHDMSQNSPPVQVSTTTLRLGQGESLSTGVLTDFVDPDGDPLALVGASMDWSYGSLVYRPDGTVTVTASGQIGATTATLMVSDGIAPPVEGTLEITVHEGSSDPTVDPVHAVGYVDQPLVVNPLAAVRSSGGEPVRLAGVGEVPGISVVSDLVAGTFTVVAPRSGTYYVSFTVVSSPNQAVGWARIDILDLPGEQLPPVTTTDIAYLPPGGSVTVDPLANDSDPNDLVLALQSVSVPEGSGLQAGVVEHWLVVISSVRTLDGPTPITYSVSNGVASATGTILVVPVPASAVNQPPVVPDRQVSVRTGGVVTVNVLDGAYDPDGTALTLDSNLPSPPAKGEGLLFVSGDVLRYQAPDRPMTVRATFQVTDAGGASTAAQLVVNVHESDAATKPPPVPKDVVARVFEGETVRIKIPLTGIDVDGDGVTLLGLGDASPTRGVVTTVGADYLEYQALPGETGTDAFTYAVEDWTGQRAVGRVQVGIVPRSDDEAAVVARDDAVAVRPGTTVDVAVLANDIDSGGGPLSLDPDLVVSGDLGTGKVTAKDGVVQVQAPTSPGILQVQYTARNDRGGQGSAVLTVTVADDAPVLPPVARDIVVPAEETIGRTQVQVDVLAVASNPSGPLSELAVAIPESAARTASVTADGKVLITLTETTQVVAYQLVNTRDRNATAYAFVTVPALGFFPPTLRPRAPELRVGSGQSIDIDLGEQVQVAPGRKPSLVDQGELKAAKGQVAAVGSGTVRFTADESYSGPASVTVRVTDATGKGDADAREATITLPITVYATDLHPPTFVATTVAVGPGDDPVSVDLNAFMKTPEGNKPVDGTYTFAMSGAAPSGFTASLDGSRLSVGAAVTTPKGTTGWLTLTIGYGQTGTMDVTMPLKVVASTRPLARVLDRTLSDGQAGKPRSVDVLVDAFDPFAGSGGGLTVVGAVVETPDAGTASFTSSSVTVRPGDDFVGSMVTRFVVQDATGDPDRQVEARITLQVAAIPAAPAAPRIVEIRDQTVVLAWNAPDPRGAEITGYRVTASPGGRQIACPSTTCTIDALTNGTSYTFTVAAQNAVGWSPESPSSAAAMPDAVPDAPAAPTVVAADGAVNVSWSAPANHGSAITGYDVEISPKPDDPGNPATIWATTTSARFTGLTNGRSYTVRVRAHNAAPQPGPWSDWSGQAVPASVPNAPGGLAVAPVDAGKLQLSWQTPANNGSPLGSYQLTVVDDGGATQTFAPASNVTSYTVDAQNGVQYTFTLRASNAIGLSAPSTIKGSTFGVPAAPQVTAVEGQVGGAYGQGTAKVTLSPGGDGGSPITSYKIQRIDNGQTFTVNGTETTVTGLMGGQAVSFQAQACNQRGCGAWSAARAVSPQPQTAPEAVPNLKVELTSDPTGQPTLAKATWLAPDWAGGANGRQYQVVWSVDGQVVSQTTTTGLIDQVTQGLPTLGDARPSAKISVTVTASTSVGTGAAATADQTASWVPGPAQPAHLSASVSAPPGNTFTGTWDPVPGAVAYRFEVVARNPNVPERTTGVIQVTPTTGSVALAYGGNDQVFFRVCAVAADGRTSTWAEARAYP